jgi:hypothetical protein
MSENPRRDRVARERVTGVVIWRTLVEIGGAKLRAYLFVATLGMR